MHDDPECLTLAEEELGDGETASGAARCVYCGEDLEVELLEMWGRAFMLSTCCEWAHEWAVEKLNGERRTAARLLTEIGCGHVGSARVRGVASDIATLVVDWNLVVVPVSFREACAFIAEHHQHNKPPTGWKFGAGIRNGQDLVGVITVGRPVARMLQDGTVVEINRLCVRRDLTPRLTHNACSQLTGWAVEEARRRGFNKIVTYTLESERGDSMRASGWIWDGRTRGGSWDSPSRRRVDKADVGPKNRWVKTLRPTKGQLALRLPMVDATRRQAA